MLLMPTIKAKSRPLNPIFVKACLVPDLNFMTMYNSAINEKVTERYEVTCIVDASSISLISRPPKLRKNPAANKHIAPKISLLYFIIN